jgi:hypothetical protein
VGALATAALQTAHAVLAARGEWVTNEKRLLERAGLREIDEVVRGGVNEPEGLVHMLGRAEEVLDAAVARARESGAE